MSGAGFMNNFIASRDQLRDRAARHRARMRELREREDEPRSEVEVLQDDIAELKLALACLLNLLIRRETVTKVDLLTYADTIDDLDGKKDGMFHGKVKPDGALAPDAAKAPKAHDAIDDLAQAAKDREQDDR